MVNKRLKNIILDVVDEQLQTGNPKCTGRTFKRLVTSGYTEKEAREMIGGAVLEDIYHMLKEKQPFDEKKYAAKLDCLKPKHGLPDILKPEHETAKRLIKKAWWTSLK